MIGITPTTSALIMIGNNQANTNVSSNGSVEYFVEDNSEPEVCENEYNSSDSEIDIIDEELKKVDILSDIGNWAVKFNISNIALGELLKILHNVIPYKMPLDARTLLKLNKVEVCIMY